MNTRELATIYYMCRSRLVVRYAVFMVVASIFTTSKLAYGEVVTLYVSGTVTSIDRTDPENFDLDGSVGVGSPYFLTFTFDSDAVDLNPEPAMGLYALTAAGGQLGGYSWSSSSTPASLAIGEVESKNNQPQKEPGAFYDTYRLLQRYPAVSGFFDIADSIVSLPPESFKYFFVKINLVNEPSATGIDSDDLIIPDLDRWTLSYLTLNIWLDESVLGYPAAVNIEGSVDSITTPEPTTISIFAMVAFACTSRRPDAERQEFSDQYSGCLKGKA